MNTTTAAHTANVETSRGDLCLEYRAWCPCGWTSENSFTVEDDAQDEAANHVTSADDLTPDVPVEWDITALAATVVWDLANTNAGDPWDRGRVSGVMAAWQSLTGLHDRAQALALAERYAGTTAPVIAHTPPF